MIVALFNADDYAEWRCPNCDENYDACTVDDGVKRDGGDMCADCYVNDDCPDGCNAEHDEPTPNRAGQWECPETGAIYRRCDWCDDWERDRWDNGSTRIGRDWVCEPSEHDYYACDDCGEWIHGDETYGNDYGGDTYCRSCYRGSHRGSEPGESERLHAECGTRDVYMDEITEAFICKCEADKRRASGIPVLVAA